MSSCLLISEACVEYKLAPRSKRVIVNGTKNGKIRMGGFFVSDTRTNFAILLYHLLNLFPAISIKNRLKAGMGRPVALIAQPSSVYMEHFVSQP